MPVIIGIILGLICLVSGVGVWGNLPNNNLLIALNATENETLIRMAIDSGQINLWLLIIWGTIFIIATTAL
ncbi:MAG: hypothetical protein SH821_10655, partial [Phototrophicales bacterium]|nr:hypothetical protein [Phototrophicales bacterium]